VKLSMKKVERQCRKHGTSLARVLREAGVSRNAFYALARKESVVPQSLVRVAEYLEVSVATLLDDVPSPAQRMERLVAESNRIAGKYEGVDADNVRHTLLLLDEKPLERLRRALRRGRSVNIR
jgi:AcrR family transcriptional regulator